MKYGWASFRQADAIRCLFVGLVCVLLLATIAPAASAAPMSKEFAVTLTSAHISAVNGSFPANPPVVVPPGGQFKAWFRVANPYDVPVRVALDVSVVDPLSGKIKDASGEITVPCTVPAQTSHICTRTFTIRRDSPYGRYPVQFGIGLYDLGPKFVITGSFDYDGWVQIEGAPVSPGPAVFPPPGLVPSAPSTVLPPTAGAGRYFVESGYWVRNGIPLPGAPNQRANFLDAAEGIGMATLGAPVSRAFYGKDGFLYQAFQRAVLQWQSGPGSGRAVVVNTMDWLFQAGRDDFLYSLGIPRHYTGPDGTGPDFAANRAVRLGWLSDPEIRAAYFANPLPMAIPDGAWDPTTYYGLPTSKPERQGPITAQRFQRYVLQKWEDQVPGMPPAGTVIGIMAGDLVKEAGMIPGAAMEPEKP
jgi:hypothetical protein